MAVITAKEEMATIKTDFYKDQVKEYRILNGLQLFLGLVIVFTIVFIITHYPKPILFNANDNYQLFQEDTLDVPQFNDAEIANWVIMTMRELFTFNYTNVDQSLEAAKEFFDSRGLQSFYNLIKTNANFQDIKNKHLIVSNAPVRSPIIASSQVSNGRYIWEINLPLRIYFENQTFNTSVTLNLKIYIARVPNIEAEAGIKITEFQLY